MFLLVAWTLTPTTLAAQADAPDPSPRGLTLDQLVELALERNLLVQVKESEVDQARALYRTAASLAYPRLDANTIIGGPTAEAKTAVQNDINTVTQSSLGGDLDFGQLGVTIRGDVQIAQPLYTFRKIASSKDATKHLINARVQDAEATRADIVLDVHRAYWALQLVQAFLNTIDEGTDTLTGVLEQIEELLDEDSVQVTENDRLRLVHALATLRVRKAEAIGGRDQANLALRILTRSPLDTPLMVEPFDLYDAIPETTPEVETTVEDARASRAELLALRQVIEAQQALVELRRANLYPDIFFGVRMNYAYTSNATEQTNPFIYDPFNDFNVGMGIGIRWEFDLFTKLARIEFAESVRSTREIQEALASDAVELEVRQIHTLLENGFDQLDELDRANRAARAWLTSTVLAYDIGTGNARELIDAFLAWAASTAQLETVRYDTVVRLSELARARGRLVALRGAPR